MYKINPKSYKSVFALPTDVIDKYLKMAGKNQLKVLLWLYRYPDDDASDLLKIEKGTGVPTLEIKDALCYWGEAGLIEYFPDDIPDSKEPAGIVADAKAAPDPDVVIINDSKNNNNPKAGEKPRLKETSQSAKRAEDIIIKPTVSDIAKRLDKSSEVRDLFREAQESFGRTLGYDAQSSLLILYDHYALPADVIITLCEYAKKIGKRGSLAYIMRVGEVWAKQNVSTLDEANLKIADMEKANELWVEIKNITGLPNPKPTAKQSEYLEIWAGEFGYDADVISYAYEKTVEKKGSISFNYMNGVLKKWRELKLNTLDAILNYEKTLFNNAPSKNKNKPSEGSDPPSFNIDLAIKSNMEMDPSVTKRAKR